MDYTDAQRAGFKEEFAKRRRRQMIVSIPAILAIVGVTLGRNRETDTLLGLSSAIVLPIFVAIVFAVAVFSWRNWRCPACDKYLGRGLGPRHCQNCGVGLRQ